MVENMFLASSPTDTPVELYVLQPELEICSIPREQIALCTHALIKLCLLSESNPRFFSFTETDDDVTIVIPTEDIEAFPSCLEKSGKLWKAFTVSTGAVGAMGIELAGVSKIAKAIISPLADCGISVFCISTYQSDFILVQEDDLDRAIQCLGKMFKIFNEQHKKLDGPKTGGAASYTIQMVTADSPCRALKQPLFYPSVEYHVTGIDSLHLSSVIQILLELMFFPNTRQNNGSAERKDRFFHFSIIDGDISFILDEDDLSKFPSNTIYQTANNESWRMVRVGDSPLGFEESGIVAKIAEPLANAQISIYYISTFNNDHALVPEEEISTVTKLLQKRAACQPVLHCNNDYDEIEK
eukprot:gene13864-15312_t